MGNFKVYIRDELFDPSQYFAFGRPCKLVCNVDNEASIHGQLVNGAREDGALAYIVKCIKSHRSLHRKTIVDVVEALIGAFLVESGFKAAILFLRWIGIDIDFEVSNVHRVCQESKISMSLTEDTDIDSFEELIGYNFKHRGLQLQALVHPSYNMHSGGCYQKLEFLGDAVLEYLITSYLYSAYPNLKPGQLTDLRSITVNNNSFALIAVWQSFHKYLIKDSNSLTEAITKFESYVNLADSQGVMLEEPACPKVLGDIVESCIGAVLLDTGFCLTHVWRLMLKILEPVLGFSTLQFNPVRELRELCQCHNFVLGLPEAEEIREGYSVAVEVGTKDKHYKFDASNHNSKAARRMAAQEALSVLKAHGFKHKNKSLEEIVQMTKKMKPILIGFDEEPIDINPDDDSISLEKLQIQESEEVPCNAYKPKAENASLFSKSNAIQFSTPLRSGGNPKVLITEACDRNEPKLNTHADSILLGNLRIREPEEVPCKLRQLNAEKVSPSSKSFVIHKQFSTPPRSAGNPKVVVTEACNGNEHRHKPVPLHQFGAYDTIEKSNQKETIDTNRTARSRLMEICTANCWNPPSYVCCKEEGPSHLRMFTYKVTVGIEGSRKTVLKCYSESKPQKKAAQEHAAEGALWYLRHLKYI